MTTIRLVFAAGRYHGTPWGRHVNEGVPEWPPSPVPPAALRALYDVWQRKCGDLPEKEKSGRFLKPSPLLRASRCRTRCLHIRDVT